MSATTTCLEFFAGLFATSLTPDAHEPSTDEALMERAARGDHDAFAELFLRYERAARTFAGRTLRDFERAEDIVQDAFIDIWRNAPRWKPRGRFRHFLFTIVSRRCIDFLRQKHPASLDDIEETSLPPAPLPDVRETIFSEQQSARLAHAIHSLRERPRLAILLVYSEGFSTQEAADAMELKLKAFESLLHRARETLRQQLASHENS